MSPNGKRVFALTMAILMALMFVVPTISTLARAADYEEDYEEELVEEEAESTNDAKGKIDDLNSKFKDLQSQQTKITAEINKAKSEKEKQLAIKEQLIGQINNTTAQIDVLTERIDLLEEDIRMKELEMKAKQAEIDKNFALLKTRMRAMYMSGGNANTVGMVLGAESYSDLILRGEVMGRVAQHDQDLLDQLAKEKAELEAIKKGIEENKVGVESDKSEMDAKNQELSAQKVQAQTKIQSLAETEKAFMADKENLQKQMAQVQAEISKIYAEINKTSSKLPYIGGTMRWPSNSLMQTTCGYGWRFGGSDFHTGIDISGSGAYGSPVVAAGNGTVAVANTSFTPGYGYGKYVIIDHGGGIQTLYGHCSALSVSVGETVTTGQKIAEVGSTGWSTGPHVHFEVREQGKAVTPLKYLQG